MARRDTRGCGWKPRLSAEVHSLDAFGAHETSQQAAARIAGDGWRKMRRASVDLLDLCGASHAHTGLALVHYACSHQSTTQSGEIPQSTRSSRGHTTQRVALRDSREMITTAAGRLARVRLAADGKKWSPFRSRRRRRSATRRRRSGNRPRAEAHRRMAATNTKGVVPAFTGSVEAPGASSQVLLELSEAQQLAAEREEQAAQIATLKGEIGCNVSKIGLHRGQAARDEMNLRKARLCSQGTGERRPPRSAAPPRRSCAMRRRCSPPRHARHATRRARRRRASRDSCRACARRWRRGRRRSISLRRTARQQEAAQATHPGQCRCFSASNTEANAKVFKFALAADCACEVSRGDEHR